MKRMICVIVILFIGISVFSQDVIITQSGESIRSKIVTVTDDDVFYKRYNDPEGATFIIRKDKIKIISWENGNLDEYDNILPEEQTAIRDDSILKNGERMPFIEKSGNTFYLDNGLVYNRDQLKQFLIDKNLSHIWSQYQQGVDLLNTGWLMIGIGAVSEIFGALLIYDSEEIKIGAVLSIVGLLLESSGIPIAIAGSVKKNRIIDVYNYTYGGKSRSQYSQNITFKVGVTDNGLGMCLCF